MGSRRRAAVLAAVTALAAVLTLVASPPSNAAPSTFVTMSDGVKISVGIQLPSHYDPHKKYPTIFEMSGYDGASAQGGTLAKQYGIPELPQDDSRQVTGIFEDAYVTVHVSVRGTGCSGGTFDLFSWKSAEDGHDIIDGWIPKQTWSN